MQALLVAWYNLDLKHEALKGSTPSDGQQPNGSRMDEQRANRAGWGSVMLAALLLSVGCSREQPITKASSKTLFDRFDHAENIEITIITVDAETKCRLPERLRNEFGSAFAAAVPEPEPLKWVVFGHVKYHSDGKDHEAPL